MASQGGSSRRSLSLTNASLQEKKKSSETHHRGEGTDWVFFVFSSSSDIQSLTDLITSIIHRMGDGIDRNNLPQILYEDEDRDKVILASDSDLAAAVDHARQVGWKGLRLHLDFSGTRSRRRATAGGSVDYAYADSAWASAYSTVAAGAALVAGFGVLAYLKRAGNN